ncbi:MAG: YwmB family TATA-box binding protein [Bacillota bacterium]|nr:YwmB family TATA-box binding protein [Bacillota bacterium]
MQKILAGIMIISITLFGGNLLYKITGEGQRLGILQEAFAATDAILVEMTMNGWAKVSSSSLNEERLKALIKVGSQASFGVIPAHIVVSSEDGVTIAQASYSALEYLIDVSAQSLPGETYLIVTIQTNNKGRGIEEAERQLKKFFQASGLKVELTTCLVGVIKGRLSSQQASVLLGQILAVLQADMQESFSDGVVMNVSAYSKRLPGGIKMAGRMQNVSITTRYNPNDGSTYLWLAWPTFSLPI